MLERGTLHGRSWHSYERLASVAKWTGTIFFLTTVYNFRKPARLEMPSLRLAMQYSVLKPVKSCGLLLLLINKWVLMVVKSLRIPAAPTTNSENLTSVWILSKHQPIPEVEYTCMPINRAVMEIDCITMDQHLSQLMERCLLKGLNLGFKTSYESLFLYYLTGDNIGSYNCHSRPSRRSKSERFLQLSKCPGGSCSSLWKNWNRCTTFTRRKGPCNK